MLTGFGRLEISDIDYKKNLVEIYTNVFHEPVPISPSETQIRVTYGFDRRVEVEPSDAQPLLKEFFQHGRTVTLAEDLLDRARHTLYRQKHFRGAFLDAFSSAEIQIESFLRAYRISKGVAESVIEQMEGEVGIAYKISIELPTILSPLTQDFRDTLRDLNAIRKVRNQIVHNGREISENEAKEAIDVVARLASTIQSYRF